MNPDEAPPLVGAAAQLIFLAMLVVMLVVPWIMAKDSSGSIPREIAGGSARVDSGRFSSDRERRLWLWTVVVLVAIYSTLGPAAELAAFLRERNLLRASSFAVLLLVVALVAAPWVRRRPGRREVGAAVGILAVYVTTMVRLPVPEARSHLFEYGLVSVLIYHALLERRSNGRRVPVPALSAIVATVLLGWLDEGIQAFLPNRVYDLADVGLNAIFGLMAVLASLFMAWARSWDIFNRGSRATD